MRNVGIPDYYDVLAVDAEASSQIIRQAFRAQVLELHPDKTAEPTDVDLLSRLIEAFEVLSNAELRSDYDRRLLLSRVTPLGEPDPRANRMPHVTESYRPVDRARAILYLLLRGRQDEALKRLRALDAEPIEFLGTHLDAEEFIDVTFLIGEVHEKRRSFVASLRWYQESLRRDAERRQPRPCHDEAVDRVKRLLIRRMTRGTEPRVTLQYLLRAERLGLNRQEQADVCKRRAQCFADMGMRDAAASSLREAMTLEPHIKGIRKLRAVLSDYL